MSVNLLSPANGETVDICAVHQREFDGCKNFRAEKKLILSLNGTFENMWDNTTPAPVVFRWETDSDESVLEISENINFENTEKFITPGNSLSVYNLKKHTEYFWRVNGSEVNKFSTDGIMPRWIKADGIGNVRDMGGRKNTDGNHIKQGLIFRGPKFENDITDEGITQLRKLGIKTELDIREEANPCNTKSLLGDDVNYILMPCKGYDEFAGNEIKNGRCRELIELFADCNNYPIYFHCAGGQDRTGTIAFLLDAILGLDDETLLREYELTMLSSPGQGISRSRKKKFKPFIKCIKKNGSKKASLRDNTITFLTNAGITQETMQKIREIMLEK